MICPMCAATVEVEGVDCAACGVPLEEYANVHYRPDRLFNDALRRLGRGQYAEACGLLAAVCAERPRDVEALLLWARAAEGRGDDAEAVRILLDAQDAGGGPAAGAALDRALGRLEESAGPATAALTDLEGRLRGDVERLEAALALTEAARDGGDA